MASELHLVVACTDRKRSGLGEPVLLRTIPEGPVGTRPTRWWHALAKPGPTAQARDVYVGDHWAIAKNLPDAVRGSHCHTRLWVASAGYGLLPDDHPIRPYSATFGPASPDSVVPADADPRPATQSWWSKISARSLPGTNTPRSIADIAANARSHSVIMVVASTTYLAAMEPDLVLAAADERIRLLLVSGSPGPRAPELEAAWVPTKAELRMAMGGALTSLHARAARAILEAIPPSNLDASAARRVLSKIERKAPDLPVHDRIRTTDEDVRRFIKRSLRANETATATGLLREYRSSGRACEQKRFRALFQAEKQI